MIPITDTHQHLWDLSKFRLPWVGAEGPLARSFVMDDYLRETKGLGITRTVYMEVDVDPAQHAEEAAYVTHLARMQGNPMDGAVISGRPDSPEFAAYLDRFQATPEIKGLRQVLHGGTPAGWCLRPEFLRGVRDLGKRGLRFDVCIRPGELADAAKLAKECPDTRFILDHCGNPNVQEEDRAAWQRGIDAVAKQPNVACKISGIVVTAKKGAWDAGTLAPFVNHCAEAFGPDRLVFGGDWPVCTLVAPLREWVGALRQIIAPWPVDRQKKLLHLNAEKVYGLGPAPSITDRH
jgi:L-fuconolactonase